jgi:predicted dehydrogenase
VADGTLEELVREPASLPAPSLGIGMVGAGWIVRECHLPAYRSSGLNVVGIASRRETQAATLAEQFDIPRAYPGWEELLEVRGVEVLDIAFPPDEQPKIIRAALRERDHIRGILAQKPLAMDLSSARELVAAAADAGVMLAVNQNMRFDRSIQAARRFLDAGRFGKPLFAYINMHAPVTWMEYASAYQRKAMLIMSVHHLDAFRFLFGDPERIMCTVAGPSSAPWSRPDESAAYILEYDQGLRAIGIDNCHSWADIGIAWRIEGTDGIAKGTVGWPDYPWGSPSKFEFVSAREPDVWFRPRWGERWFPDAFAKTMGELLRAILDGNPPEHSAADNLRTMALLEAAYLSADEHRSVAMSELLAPSPSSTHEKAAMHATAPSNVRGGSSGAPATGKVNP